MLRKLLVMVLTAAGLSLAAGCDSAPGAGGGPSVSAPATAPADPRVNLNDPKYVRCWLHVAYHGPDATFKKPYDQLRGPKRYASLRGLQGTQHDDWSGRITHMTVGPQARVTVWSEENFSGEKRVHERNAKIELGDRKVGSLLIEYAPE